MAHNSPLRQRHDDAGAAFLLFADHEQPERAAPVVDTFGSLESEYAAIRKGAALMDLPQRGAIRVTGADRVEFLNRMLTQELRPQGDTLASYRNANSFWLNRKGRIDADLRITQLPDRDASGGATAGRDDAPFDLGEGMIFDLDIISAPGVVQALGDFVFAEDIALTDVSDQTHRFAVHGPAGAKLIADNATPHERHPGAPSVVDIAPGQSTVVRIAGRPVLVDRDDMTGEIGLHLLCHIEHAVSVFDQLAQHARDDFGHHNDPATDAYKLRHAGWAAFNVARIEAGTPLFRVDFSTTNLPAESGLLDHRVSFTKGCYLGQEVVARMHALGNPKQTIAPLRIDGPEHDSASPPGADSIQANTPDTGAAIFPADPQHPDKHPADDHKPIGAVTSCTQSPMLGGAPIALAQLKWNHHLPGTTLWLATPAGYAKATVNPTNAFWTR